MSGCCGCGCDDDDDGVCAADNDVLFRVCGFSILPVIQEEQGVVGDGVPAASEEEDLLLQVVPLPQREAVELLDGHPENTKELLLRQVSLQGARDKQKESLTDVSNCKH